MENIPQIMSAIEIGDDGSTASLKIADAPVPSISDYEILVRVAAAGVNRGDCFQRAGFYPAPSGASTIMGLEFSGTVAACGDKVSKWKIGDRVAALVAGGGYAQYASVHENHALEIPENLSFIEAAALPETIYTVWANVFEGAFLRPEETILIHGGSSGIGTTAIQMAKIFGAQVIVTAGSKEKCDACLQLGADLAINYRDEDFVKQVNTFTQEVGAHVILDMVGGDYISRNMACAARGGRIVNIAFLHGSKAEVDFMPVMIKNLTLTGSTLRARSIAEKSRLTDAVAEAIWPDVGLSVKPVIDKVFPLAQAGAAQARMEASEHIGKIILDCEADI